MAKLEIEKDTLTLTGAAVASATLVGLAWLMDALRRDRWARQMHRKLVDLLLNALTADDPVTARHSRRVADLTSVLAGACGGLSRPELATLRVAALLHDMGKIDDRFFLIVHSRKRLSEEQRAEIKHHPHLSATILQPLEEMHPGIQKIVSSHHECWDGSGYPCGIGGHEIPLAARIIAVADVFDAMTQPRKYKGPMPVEEALEKLDEGAGHQFDPRLVALVESGPVLAQWTQIALQGQRDEQDHLENPNPTERAIEHVAAEV
ncbi:HD-GYP domain-containing protein [Longimicrobium sp.]|uniref:HD-GYP domain-containing protein n=1 Tax=Longimicrobium sp. TaxID=2029185 RepID=UPI002BD32AA8|nr:HD domain-containing phosphohydrolase [Longimicrobium sp.]HSU17200.1 HD domain-containing phosphohydrolase [Longimicrobium sp.]